MKYIIYFMVCLLFICSCRGNADSFLEKAGNNKGELQKVIDHYTQEDCDPYKLKAARFLLTNMDGCYSFGGETYRNYLAAIDSMSLSIGLHQLFLDKPIHVNFQMFPDLEKESDLSKVSAKYLINHIDYVFRLWRTEPWLKGIDFEDICEYLLPYRIDNEPLVDWENGSAGLRKQLYRTMHCYDDTKYSIANLGSTVLKEAHNYSNYNPSVLDARLPLIGDYKMACEEIAYVDLLLFRMAGIPSAIDCIPYWGDADGMHMWATPVTKEKIENIDYLICNRKMPKVYRKTFSRRNESDPDREIKKYAFDLSDNRLTDVTEKYVNCFDIDLDFECKPKKNYKYLAVFNNRAWRPAASSQTSHFSKMGAGIVYIPLCLKNDGGTEQILSYPFILQENGEMQNLKPDKEKLQRLVLLRKFPYESRKAAYNISSKGTVFYGSNNADFSDCDTLHVITDDIMMRIHRVVLSGQKKYRYIKVSPSNSLSLAELKFYDDNELTVAECKSDGPYTFVNNLFDNDRLSFTIITEDLVIDLGSEQKLKTIVFQGRNDGNNIEPGDNYELLYMTLDGWKSCGNKIAESDSIVFDNVPGDALYWLRDKSKGIEERIFTMSNGEQRFW